MTRRRSLRNVIYDWVDRRNRYPWWVKVIWPRTHWCSEMDDLLITWNTFDCCCADWPEEWPEEDL